MWRPVYRSFVRTWDGLAGKGDDWIFAMHNEG
jgi:hypothetical protein